MTYKSLIEKIYSFRSGNQKSDLSLIHHIHQQLGSPGHDFEVVHVAGTNGKGSVCTKISKALELEGKKTGLFTSPHLHCFQERIQINGKQISEARITELLQRLFSFLETTQTSVTFFEIATLAAFLYFSEENIDVAVVETGIGGRLDATNIVHPRLSIITSVSLDHTELLGTTAEEITREKAGIIKPGKPILIGSRVPKQIVRPIAQNLNSPFHQVKGSFQTYPEENCAIAEAAMKILGISEENQRIALQATPPCRLETLQINAIPVILDVAHNPDGLACLFKTLKKTYPTHNLKVIVGLSKSKDLNGCLNILKENGSHFYPVEAPNGYGIPKMMLADALYPHTQTETISQAIEEALKGANQTKDLLLICGTFYIMEEARNAIGKHRIV